MWGAEIYQDMHDLKEKLGKKGKLPDYCEMVEVAMSHISGAQHFFCGEKVDLESPFKGFAGKRIFMGEMAEGVSHLSVVFLCILSVMTKKIQKRQFLSVP